MWVRVLALTLFGVLAGCSSKDLPSDPPDPPAATAPTITTQPAAASVTTGQTANFTVAASGTAPFTYQWRRNGVDLAGATSASYTTAAVVLDDDGASYTAIVTNSVGSATSAVAVLTVTLPFGTAAAVELDQTTRLLTSVGETTLLGARAVDADGLPVAGAVTWTSSNPLTVSVDSIGHITAQRIGSAMLFADSGGKRSLPVFVLVAEPVAGALMIGDEQVIAIGDPIGLADGEAPGVGTRYEVTVSGIAMAPAAGTVVLASGDKPVAGKVVSTRTEGGNLVLTLELAALPDMLARYDIDWDVDLARMPFGPIEIHDDASAFGKIASRNAGRANVANKFEAFSCDGEVAANLLKTDISLTPQIGAHLILKSAKDDPSLTRGYGKLALVGSQALSGTVGIKLNAGFSASASCIAQGQMKIPVGGVVSIIVMPALRFGVGFEVGGQFVVASGELKLTGTIGAEETLGFECNPLAGGCVPLSDATLIDDFKYVKTLPTLHDMHVELTGQVFAVVGIDAVFGLVLFDAEIVEARIGPKQTFDFAFPNDQAENHGAASNYHLDLDGVIQPGASLSKAIKKYVGDDNVTLNFKAPYSTPLAASPKGTMEISETDIAYDEPVDFQVHLNNPLTYPFLGEDGGSAYNVDNVQIWRKKAGEAEFTLWSTLGVSTPGQTTFQTSWTPELEDVGDYEFAAFVQTAMPVPILEINENSIKQLHVRGAGWSGTVTYTIAGSRTYSNMPAPGATQDVVVTDAGSGAYRLETVTGEDGLPLLSVAEGTANVIRTRTGVYFRDYTFDDCHITQQYLTDSVEPQMLEIQHPSTWSMAVQSDGSFWLNIPGMFGQSVQTEHVTGTFTSTGAAHCVPEPALDETRTYDLQADVSGVSIFLQPGDDPNVLTGTVQQIAGGVASATMTVTYNLHRD